MDNLPERTWSKEENALEVWKYYGGVGGADKDTMIKIVTWLLGFSTVIIGVYSTDGNSFAKVLLTMVGILVSILAAFTAILYGAYATWNWSIADRIAEAYDWKEQKPDFEPFPKSRSSPPLMLAKPCQNKIAPVFWVFFYISMVSLGIHFLLLFHSICIFFTDR